MAIRNMFIAAATGYLLLVIFSMPLVAQDLRVISKTDEFIDYEFMNENLTITAPDYLMVPWDNGEARYRILEQEIVPVTVDSSRLHYAQQPDHYQIADRRTPIVEIGDPGHIRGSMRAPLTIHIARQNESGSKTFQVIRRLRVRVYSNESAPAKYKEAPATTDTDDSPLASGEWYKIPIPDDNLYYLDSDYLNDLGIDVPTIDPRNLQLWTTNGYELPHMNSAPRPELTQVPIIVEDESDGSFDDQDRVLFYANGPDRYYYDDQLEQFEHRLHPFANRNYVFLTLGSENGRRLSTTEPVGTATREVREFRDFRWLEEDLEKSESRIKSGTQWFGQGFDPSSSPAQTIFSDTLAGFQSGSDIRLTLSMAARSTVNSNFNFSVNGYTSLSPLFINSINSLTDATGLSARVNERTYTIEGFSLDNDIITINATFNNTRNDSRGWVDWIHLRADRALHANNDQLRFHPPDDADGSPVRYLLDGFDEEPIVLDITDPVAPVRLHVNEDDEYFTVTHSSERHRQLIAATRFVTPPSGESIPNQNIHNPSGYPDYVIITDEDFREEARRLADYREEHDGLTPVIVSQSQIFNEFNGGVPDFVALRDYVKHLYDRATDAGQKRPEYLLMFGGTTYDYKGVIHNPPMQNHVFTYQSEESISRTSSYGSDDFFGFMGDDEGTWPRSRTSDDPVNLLDIGVGRLSIQSVEDARLLVDKIQAYEDPRNRGDWQSLFTFIADDDVAGRNNDRDLHILNADGTADVIDKDATGIRLEKIYQISYPFEFTSAGQRVPQATQAMIDRINDGTLVFNFSGHGAEQFITDQRLFTAEDIPRLNNLDRLSIMVTATCSFGRFDDTDENSGAEKMLLYQDGGLIATFTTTRVVYTSRDPSSLNFGLNIALTREMTRRDSDGRPQRLGDIFRKTKITPVGSDFNARKFILLGDPAMRLGLPESQLDITHINGNEIHTDSLFDLRALDKVSISGQVAHSDGAVNTSFDGEANVRVLDAERLVSYPERDWVTAGNCYLDNCGYFVQNDALFNGRVSVSAGEFNSEFIIPKDVAYSNDPGRIQVYARERDSEAVGSNSNFRISGRNPDAEDTRAGPDIDIYMNDEMFTDGGIVNDAPRLIVILEDDAGINTTGAGVGHEIVAIIENQDDETDRRTVSLNEFYQSNLDDFTSGRIEYPLDGLEEGHYRLTIRAWDVFNNMGESEITFQVLDSQELQIRNVFNYPNPMHNFTSFVFEHNQPGTPLDINIRIYTLSGRPVTTIRREQYISAGNMVRIDWQGRDDDHNRLATGTYLYHIQIRAETDQGRQTKDKIERLVILQ